MTFEWLCPGVIVELPLPRCWGVGLAGNHPVVVMGTDPEKREIYGLGCTSRPRREADYLLPRGVLALTRDTFVVTSMVRELDESIWQQGRVLDRLPEPYMRELRQRARRALRGKGLAR